MSFCRSFNRRLPSTFIIYDAYNCSNLCVCVGVSVCVCRKALLVFALWLMSYAKPFLIRGHVGCGMWQAKCGMRHAAQKEAAQVSARTVLKFTLEWSFCRCKQNVVVLAAVVPFIGLSQGLGLGLGLARVCVGSRSGSRSSSLLDCTFN